MAAKTRAMPKRPSTTVTLGGPGAQVRTESNAVPFVAPGAFALVLWGMALLERRLLKTDEYAWYWSVFVAALYAGATGFAWWASRPRGAKVNVLLTGAVGFVGLWTWYMIGVPHQTWRPHVVYWGVALATWAAAVMYLANKGTGDGQGNVLDGVGKAVANLRAVNEVSVSEHGEVSARYQMTPGTPAAALQQDTAAIAALLPGVRPDGVRVMPSKDDATVGRMMVSPVDRLAVPPPWTQPSIPEGGTADDPMRLGVRETGGWSEFWLTADPATMRAAPLVAIVGASGSGKTVLVKELGLEILSRMDVEYWLADPRKAGQLPDWLKRGAARVAAGRREVADMLKDFAAEISARADQLGAHGCEVWSSKCCYAKHGIKLRVLIGDEMAAVASDLPEMLTGIAESARSTGSVPIWIFQRGTGDRFPTTARAQFNAHICLGVQSEDDAVHGALPDDVLDAGAMPWLWGANQPGKHILAAPGVPDELRASACRTFDARKADQLMAQWAEHYIAKRNGEQFVPPPAVSTPVPIDDLDDEVSESEIEDVVADMIAEDLEAGSDLALAEVADEVPAMHPEDAEEMALIAQDAGIPDIPPPAGDDVIAIAPKVSPSEARRMVYDYIVRLRAAGQSTFRVVDHIEWVVSETGMKKSWLYKIAESLTVESDLGAPILVDAGEREPYNILPARPAERDD